jgi:hypothetical protein
MLPILNNEQLTKRVKKIEKRLCCCQDGSNCVGNLSSILSDVNLLNIQTEGEYTIDLSKQSNNILLATFGSDNSIRIIENANPLAIGSTFYFTTSQFGGNAIGFVADSGVTINGEKEYFIAYGIGGVVKLVYLGDDNWSLEPVCNIFRIEID